MIHHHIQREIVTRLTTKDALRFSELQPDDLDNKMFDYHLKLLIRDKIVEKNKSGEYKLTAFGRKIGVSAGLNLSEWMERAHTTLFLIIRRKDGQWLLYKRKSHPLIGRVGFMHARPNARENIVETAKKAVKQRTNLDADFAVRANGYFRVFDGDNLESFTHFSLLVSENTSGELKASDEYAEYGWYEKPNFSAKDMLPNMNDLGKLYADPSSTFIEKTYHI